MIGPLVACIANFSEGRRLDVVRSLCAVVEGVSGVYLLDRHSDPDHNRTVLTFVGAPDSVQTAAFVAIETAARLIDMDTHSGQHPCIGAADVVPFVPLCDVTMADCVHLARSLGQRVGDQLGLPVYLYEHAALRSNRRSLPLIRRGGYQALKTSILTDTDRAPDFGPARLGSAGATVIGARGPLIAFNIYLTTDDVGIARQIARTIRESSGGLPCVRALGLRVGGCAQVSMNLTDYTRTPPHRAVAVVRQQASHLGTTIDHSELVGLIPRAALSGTSTDDLGLVDFDTGQILEARLRAVLGSA
jgi:glutamate formiminotransferase